MADPILKPVSSLLTAAIDAIVAARPSTLPHFNTPGSRYNDLVTMWRGQALLLQKRLASEVKARRLATAGDVSFDALRSLCASEFGTSLPVTPQAAFATVTMTRPFVGGPGTPSGTIKAGTPFTMQANPNASPLPIQAASYVVARTMYVPGQTLVLGVFTDVLTIQVQLVATTGGSGANVPTFANYAVPTSIQPSIALYDPNWVVSSVTAAGGSSGLTNAALIAASKAFVSGQFGPTLGAAIAGVLQQQSVRHLAIFPASAKLPYAQLYIADESWAYDTGWGSQVLQNIQLASEPWVGFGCRVRMGGVTNQAILCSPTIVLANSDDLANTDDIDVNVRAAAESYFNDRRDWYVYRNASLQAAISAADPRILQCSAVTVTDAVTGNSVPEQTSVYGQWPYQPTLTHLYLTDANCNAVYQPPH